MFAELNNPAFQDDDLAREWFEARIWPNGPVCPHCGSFGEGVTRLQGTGSEKGKRHRPGCFQCNACRQQFTVTVKTVMERSKIPLHIWLKAMYLLSASKKGMSTHQLHRMLGVSLKSTWFLMHRIRDAMREPYFGSPMGGFQKPCRRTKPSSAAARREPARSASAAMPRKSRSSPWLTASKPARSMFPRSTPQRSSRFCGSRSTRRRWCLRTSHLLPRPKGRFPGRSLHG
jgi:transposase-like protein